MHPHRNHLTKHQPLIGFLLIFPLVFSLLNYTLPPQITQPAQPASAQGEFTVFLPYMRNGNPITLPSVGSDWTQEGHDAQHTGYTGDDPLGNWTLAWTWNGADANGGPGGHFYDAPKDARTVTGGAHVYVPAGSAGLYALTKSSGSVAWHFAGDTFNATPAYDVVSGALIAGSASGTLYKFNAGSGALMGSYSAGSALNKAVMIGSGAAYVTSQDGRLHKVNIGNMSSKWVYEGGSQATLPPALSTSGVIVYGTEDLYVHGVSDASGSQLWRVKPTSLSPSVVYTYDGYWPVIAEKHGIVLIRLNLGMEALWSGPGCGEWGCGVYPASNQDTRALLQADGGWRRNLYALKLSDGSESFVPAVGFGGVEALDDSGAPILENGPMPVIKVLDDGSEVAYIPFRSGQGSPQDGRWDSHLGEMVLDGSTVPGMEAGDLRFINTHYSTNNITDEQTPLSMAGNTIFIAHWGASMSLRITNRSGGLGLQHDNPIQTEALPSAIRRQQACGDFNPASHWTSCGLTLFDDGRYWDGPGFWAYWNVMDPPTPSRGAYSEGLLPRYTYVADGLIIIEGNGGDLMALRFTP